MNKKIKSRITRVDHNVYGMDIDNSWRKATSRMDYGFIFTRLSHFPEFTLPKLSKIILTGFTSSLVIIFPHKVFLDFPLFLRVKYLYNSLLIFNTRLLGTFSSSSWLFSATRLDLMSKSDVALITILFGPSDGIFDIKKKLDKLNFKTDWKRLR